MSLIVTAFPANRIVVYGDDMLDAVEPDSAQPFNFQIAYDLSDEEVRLTFSMKELDRDQFKRLSYNKFTNFL